MYRPNHICTLATLAHICHYEPDNLESWLLYVIIEIGTRACVNCKSKSCLKVSRGQYQNVV